MDSVKPAEINTPATAPSGTQPQPGGPPVKPSSRVRRRTLLLTALGVTAVAVPLAVLESRADDAAPRKAVFTLPDGYANCVAFSPDGKTLATGLSGVRGTDSTLRLWDVAEGTATAPWPDQIEDVTKMAFSPDGKTLATVDQTLEVSLWDRTYRTRVLLPHPELPLDLAFAPDGRTLATGGRYGAAWLWDLATRTVTAALTTRGVAVVNSVAFSPDGRTLATGSADLTISPVRLWDVRTRTVQATLDAPLWHGFKPVAFSPDGRSLATGSADNIVRVWDTSTGTAYATLTGHTGPVTTVAFSPDGKTLATGGEDRTVRLWDTSTLDVVPVDILTGHTDEVTSVTFSPDGRTVASASPDRTVRLWPNR